jgi:hypothetical protein
LEFQDKNVRNGNFNIPISCDINTPANKRLQGGNEVLDLQHFKEESPSPSPSGVMHNSQTVFNLQAVNGTLRTALHRKAFVLL